MIEHLGRERGLSREDAYILCSLAGDLKITEVVDAPNWMVACSCPTRCSMSYPASSLVESCRWACDTLAAMVQ